MIARRLALGLWLGLSLSAMAEDWLPIRETALEIAPGSPLDFSSFLPSAPIGPERHLLIEDGRFALSTDPARPEPLLCASLAWSPASGGFPPHAEADRYARQLAMRGYNIARFHFLDAALMFGRNADFDLDPETLDRVHYLMAALKREGISWMIDGLTSWRGGFGGHEDRWEEAGTLKFDVQLTEEGFAHWRTLQEAILGAVNPYTGLTPLEDPALALVVLVNEGGLEFASLVGADRRGSAYPEILQPGFNAWLLDEYGSTEALARAWGRLGWGALGFGESLEAGTVALPDSRYGETARLRDLQRFFLAAETGAAARMETALREMGYRGAVSSFNNWPLVQASLSREGLDAVTMNVYFDWVAGYFAGARVTQQSSIVEGLDYVRLAAGTRWLGAPFILTEYDHLFWNRHRYEAGLAMPAYAALQGWDGLCRHGHGPIVLAYGEDLPHKRQMLPYAIALDPVARAGETLAALLFRRGDVAPAHATIPFLVTGDADLGPNMQAREPLDLTALAALSAIGLSREPGEVSVPQPRASTDFARMVEAMARAGLVPEATRIGLSQGLYRSDTGEIAIAPERGLLTLVTERSEAAAFAALDAPLRLGAMTIEHADGAGLFALSALDGRALAESGRILVVFATDARNTDMRFADADAREILDFGRLPVLIRKGAVGFTLSGEGRWQISPVGLDGRVGDVLAEGTGALRHTLSNDTPAGPTTFFLIERE